MTAPISVIVPVHNEASLISATASTLLATLPEAAEVVFACNGCTDDSVRIVKGFDDPRVRVIEIAEPGKARAIREAEGALTAFPRFYVDSDVICRGDVLARLAAVLEERDLDLVAPRILFDETGSSWAARAVNSIWLALPHGLAGSYHHVLGVSARAREHWSAMPDILADDAFIEAQMSPDRKQVIADVSITTRPPRSLWSFIKVRERWLRGDRELRRLGLQPPRVSGQRRALLALARRPGHVLPTGLYIVARLLAQGLSMMPASDARAWYRDATSR